MSDYKRGFWNGVSLMLSLMALISSVYALVTDSPKNDFYTPIPKGNCWDELCRLTVHFNGTAREGEYVMSEFPSDVVPGCRDARVEFKDAETNSIEVQQVEICLVEVN